MLLETLDIKKNDLIIYSQNVFNLEKNFKVMFKDDPALKPHQITYGEICACINEFTPKSLIVYRLLTNLDNFSISRSRYGFLISINGEHELIYFDPIYALKEMEEYINASANYDIRFRIQQVGLTTLTRKHNTANYAEIYSIDLTGVEALNLNDKAFVDALLTNGVLTENETNIENKFAYKLIEETQLNFNQAAQVNKGSGRNIEVNSDNSNHPHSFSEFLKRKIAEADKKKQEKIPKPFLDIFYSNESLEKLIEGRENNNIILKLEP